MSIRSKEGGFGGVTCRHLLSIAIPCSTQQRLLNWHLIIYSTKPVHILHFIQTPQPNPKRKEPEFVSIHLLLLRLKEQGTDIVIAVNEPHYKDEYVKAVEGQSETELMKKGEEITKKIIETFDIKDWGLFNGA